MGFLTARPCAESIIAFVCARVRQTFGSAHEYYIVIWPISRGPIKRHTFEVWHEQQLKSEPERTNPKWLSKAINEYISIFGRKRQKTRLHESRVHLEPGKRHGMLLVCSMITRLAENGW